MGFYKETHIRDEDDEMKKFIESEMGKIKGKDLEVEKESEGSKYLSPEDAALQALPEHLKKSTFKKDQQMLSAQMLAGIPEVYICLNSLLSSCAAITPIMHC